MVEQRRGVSAELTISEKDRLDRGESGGWVIEDFGDSRVRGVARRQTADGKVGVLLLHAFGESPGAVNDQQSAITIGFAEDGSADAKSDVAVERFGAVIGIRPEDEAVSSAQRLDRTLLPVFAAMDNDDCGMMEHAGLFVK